jgi:RimJ/RimL family protein N-acetyltransferase
MRAEDHADLCAVGLDPALWLWITHRVRTPDDMRSWMDEGLRGQVAGTASPYVLVDRRSGQVVGSSRLFEFDAQNRRVEIGWTWLARSWQHTAINTEAKLLLLGHAFETLQCLRVQLKTNSTNEVSQRAIRRLGAVQEGVLRSFRIDDEGHPCDVVVFSILTADWPAVKASLTARLRGTT